MTDSQKMAAVFLTSAPASLEAERLPRAKLQALLEHVVEDARARWPTFAYPADAFVGELAARLPDDVVVDDHLAALPAADLYLAYACARAVPEAVQAFETHVMPVVARALGRLGAQADAVDEVEQRLRERFLVGSAQQPPAIGRYAGYGSLGSWVRVSALREYYGLARDGQRYKQLEDAELPERMEGGAPDPGPELGFLKQKYRPEFRAALAEAMTCLDARQRNVLRHHYLDGLQVEQIGRLYRVHRVTASRWLAAARQAVLSHTRRLLSERLRLEADEFASIVRLVQSQLDLSIRAHLRLTDDGR